MWSLDNALELVREIQPQLHARKYHVAMGGGVLNKGFSEKDLDLYIFPFDNSEIPPILSFLVEQWGEWAPLWATDSPEDYPADNNFGLKVKFQMKFGRIDAFITHNGVSANVKVV
jgi:hypothetical protein